MRPNKPAGEHNAEQVISPRRHRAAPMHSVHEGLRRLLQRPPYLYRSLGSVTIKTIRSQKSLPGSDWSAMNE